MSGRIASRTGAARCALLVMSMLSGCAANDFGFEVADGRSSFTPSGSFGAYLSGRSAARRADFGLAADRLEFTLTLDPGLQEITTQAFAAAALAGHASAARLAASLPGNPIAQLVLADRDAKAGNWDVAEGRFAALPQQGLTQVLRPLVVAWAQQGAGRPAAALATLAPMMDGQRFRAIYTLHAAIIADLAGQAEDAARLYKSAQSEYGALNLRLGVILASWQARQGMAAEAQRTLRDLAGSNGDLAIARQALEASVAAPVVRNAADGIAEAYLALAATLRQQNAEDSAQILLRLALDMRPDLTAARLVMADVQDAAKRQESALATLGEVPTDDPLIAVVRLREASLLETSGQSDQAGRVLNELAQKYPERPEPLAQTGDVLRRKSRFAEAAAAYDAAIARLGVPTRANWPLFYERGVAYERAGQWTKAEADFEYALQLAPDQPSVLNYLGYAWTEKGMNLGRARGLIEKAVQQRPNEGAFIDSLGWVLMRQGDAAGALAQLEKAVELLPEDPVINSHLGDALAAVGRLREAEFQWRRALNLKPEAEDAQRITAKLDSLVNAPVPAQAAAPSPSVP